MSKRQSGGHSVGIKKFAMTHASGEQPPYRKKQEAAEAKEREARRHQDNIEVVRALNALVSEIERERNERQTSERANNLREWVGIGGIYLAAFVAIWAILSSGHEAAKSRSQMQTQLDIMQTQTRPWVGMQISISKPLTFGSDGATIEFDIASKNYGSLPATNISIEQEPVPEAWGTRSSTLPEAMERADLRAERYKQLDVGFSLFPGQDTHSRMPIVIKQADIDRVAAKAEPRDSVAFEFIFRMDYRLGGIAGETRQVYYLTGVANPADGNYLPIDTTRSAQELHLVQLPMFEVTK
jgi:hypothetical protein